MSSASGESQRVLQATGVFFLKPRYLSQQPGANRFSATIEPISSRVGGPETSPSTLSRVILCIPLTFQRAISTTLDPVTLTETRIWQPSVHVHVPVYVFLFKV